ncbi:MAG: ATP-binding protein [Gemmatimonadota bacterium]|nr:ATP-binding protein [Gemmatimonadota bacterium]
MPASAVRIPLRSAAAALAAGAVVMIAAAAWVVARRAAEGAIYDQGERRLASATELGAGQLRASRGLPLDSVARALALATGYRVSVFDGESALLADSDLGPAAADTLSDRSGRSEVRGALLRAAGSSRRTSLMDGQRYLFAATRLYREGEPVVIRFGDPVGPMRAAAARVAHLVGAGVLAGGLVFLVLAHRAAGSVTRPLGDVRRLLARLAAGRSPGSRVKLSGVTELARLASSANRVRAEVEEQVARVSRERDELAQLMDEVAEGLMALTSDARILRINPAAQQLLGVADVPPFAPVGSIVRDPVLRDLLEASVVRPQGRLEVTVGGRELEVRTKMGTGGGSVVLLVDVTEMRRLEAVRSDFVANASHELKTPLTVIRAAAETVMDEGLPPDLRRRFLASIEGNTVRLQRLVDDLLDLSRYESGEWRPARERVEIDRVARAAWREQEAAAGRRGVEFEIAGAGGAVGDEAAVYQIFRNLFENSLRYVPEGGGRIGVEIGSRGGHVVVAVKDNGAGIPAASLSRIFERFYRVDAARSRQEGGTGLGLAIVRHLVSSMGGEVRAESAWGAGTTITFSVPLHRGVVAGATSR